MPFGRCRIGEVLRPPGSAGARLDPGICGRARGVRDRLGTDDLGDMCRSESPCGLKG